MPDAAPARDRGAPPPPLADAFGGGGDAGATDAGIAPPDSGPQGDGGPSTGDGGPDAADDGAVDGPGPDAVLEAGPGDLGSSVDLPTADATTDDGPLAGG